MKKDPAWLLALLVKGHVDRSTGTLALTDSVCTRRFYV